MKMQQRSIRHIAAAIVTAAAVVLTAAAQQAAPASIHGHAQNQIGQPMQDEMVRLTKNMTGDIRTRKWLYTFKTDSKGDYKGAGIEPGTYFIQLTDGEKNIDYVDNQKFAAGEDKLVNFDLTRQAYLDTMTPEQKAQMEELKAKNADANVVNVKVANVNTVLLAVRADLAVQPPATPNYDQDVAQMKSATDQLPTESLLWMEYGTALMAKAQSLTVAAKAAHQLPQSDPTIAQTYQSGIDADQKAVTLDAASKKPNLDSEAATWNAVGVADANLGKIPEAQNAFEQAVKVSPKDAAKYYYNEAAVLFNAGNTDAAGVAADKAIAADPARADAYFIRGQVLITKATVDASGKVVPPPGCVDAYQKYLELAPDGSQSATVKEILTSLGEKINTKYNAGKKK